MNWAERAGPHVDACTLTNCHDSCLVFFYFILAGAMRRGIEGRVAGGRAAGKRPNRRWGLKREWKECLLSSKNARKCVCEEKEKV